MQTHVALGHKFSRRRSITYPDALMRTTTDDQLHSRHCEALMRQLVKDTAVTIVQFGIHDPSRVQELTKDILFSVCVVLDGSAHAGSLDGQPIAPFVGFYLGSQTDDLLVPEDGSGTHEYIADLVDEHFSSAAGVN